MADPVLVTYRTDEEYRTAVPDLDPAFPAGWHRAACARIAQEVPGLSITFASDALPGPGSRTEPDQA